jgi:phosphohistidine phosphatase
LIIVRHARAESFADSDRHRGLTPSGVNDARLLGAWLLSVGVEPERVLVSTADRTRQTWHVLVDVTRWGVSAEFEDVVYAGDTDTLMDEIRETPGDCSTTLLLGHNPAMAYLAQILTDGDGDPTIELAMMAGFPPGTAAVFEIAGEWPELGPGSGRLVEFRTARSAPA